jgi:hypothetical protein
LILLQVEGVIETLTYSQEQCHCKHIAIGGGVAPLLSCIANNLGIPCPMIMVRLCIPFMGGFLVISCIRLTLTLKRISAMLHCSIHLAIGSVATISWMAKSPSLLLRLVPCEISSKHLGEMITLNIRCHGWAVIGMPFHTPHAWHNVPDPCPSILIHLRGQAHHTEGRG